MLLYSAVRKIILTARAQLLCKLFPAIYLVVCKADVCSVEVRCLAGLLLSCVIVECLDSCSAEDSDSRNVAYYHQALEHVSCIPYETCGGDSSEEYEDDSDNSEDDQLCLVHVSLEDECKTTFAV